MPLYLLDNDLWFPDVDNALDDGLLAIGGDLSPERLLLGYHSGIFPWFNDDDPIMWWSPDPRFVLFPANLKVSKSMKQVIKKNEFEFRMDTAFEEVINNCRLASRKGEPGTWITEDIAAAYTQLHKLSFAHSAEAWQNGKLVGGLYGIWLGNVFFGESMFSHKSNASKFAFISLVGHLIGKGVVMIDCQVFTDHLQSLGADMISRADFMDILASAIPPAPQLP
jgi:leucyl/phenylalanyl-tRNA--protein transferase